MGVLHAIYGKQMLAYILEAIYGLTLVYVLRRPRGVPRSAVIHTVQEPPSLVLPLLDLGRPCSLQRDLPTLCLPQQEARRYGYSSPFFCIHDTS